MAKTSNHIGGFELILSVVFMLLLGDGGTYPHSTRFKLASQVKQVEFRKYFPETQEEHCVGVS